MNKKGFTLVEIMATIAILSILAVIGTVSVSKMLQKSREKAMIIQENSLVESASMFIEDYCNNPIGNDEKEKCKELYTKSGYEKGNEIEKYVCISDLKQEGYFDEKLNFHTSPCTGFIIQKIDSKTNKIKTSKTYVQCKNEKNEIVYASKMGEDFNIYNYTKCSGIYYGRYHIVYDKNTGTGNIPKTTCVYEKPCNITSEQYTKNKYLFTGWNTKADGSGKSYSNGEEVSKLVAIDEGEFKLYAQYSAKIYTVKYNGNGATSGNMVDTQYAFDEKKALSQNAYQKAGYTFKGWSRTQNSEYIEFEDKEEIEGLAQEHREQITLYAVWEANKYTLTFDANGGSLAQTTKTVTYDSQYGSLPTPSKDGYTFLGWYKGSLSTLNLSDLSGLLSATYIKEDDIVKITEDTTLTAIYWANTLHIIYNVSTADSISSPVTATNGTTYYWKINANKNIERSTDNSTYSEKFFKKLYNETVDLINYNYDKYLNVIKSGYKLVDGKEWCTGQNGAGTCFDQTKEYTPLEMCSTINTGNCEITLYANWIIEKITYTMLANSFSCSNTSAGSAPYIFKYTGKCSIHKDNEDDWRIKLLSSGTATVTINDKIDVFLVGGGGGGTSSAYYYSTGGGGGGGYTKTVKNIQLTKNTNYSVTIGAGGAVSSNGGTTSGFGYSAAGGKAASGCNGGAGGSGGGSGKAFGGGPGGSNGGNGTGTSSYYRDCTYGVGQGTTTREFGDSTGTIYSGGGGGAGYYHSTSGQTTTGGAGGSGGGGKGGNGGYPSGTAGKAGTANTGGGGGGGESPAAGAAGGSGIVVIRNKR